MYDVIVAGAGPAGCTAAMILSERGLSVLLAEKSRIPREKSCSGQLISRTIELTRRYFGENVPESVTCTPSRLRGMVMFDEKGREYRFEQECLNVWRSSFDAWLAEKAVGQGEQLRELTAVIGCEEMGNYTAVTLRDKTEHVEQARYFIDCTGIAGNAKHRGSAVSTRQDFYKGSVDLDPHYFYAFLQPEFSGYDAWLNVKDGLIVIGTATVGAENPSYKSRFMDFLKREHGLRIEEHTRSEVWAMPEIRPGCYICHGSGRSFFAGEAAGFLNPMGEGISSAMESGCCAALAIAQNAEQPEKALAAYQQRTEDLRAYMLRQWSFVSGMSEKFRKMKI